jgi:hypothetical protein
MIEKGGFYPLMGTNTIGVAGQAEQEFFSLLLNRKAHDLHLGNGFEEHVRKLVISSRIEERRL